ncbi:MAG: dihydrofolate reductase [Planctomycetota bacterium]|nr:MAG: dihydrofolate reductase [Planctomycetota bacterium]
MVRGKSQTRPKNGNDAKTGRSATKRAAAQRTPSTSDRHPLFRAYLAVSLDGYIADSRGSVDWLNPYFSPEIDFGAFMRSIGAIVVGRATYDWAAAHGGATAHFGGRTIVMTHRPILNVPAGVEAYSGDVRPLVERLKRELAGRDKDVWLMGGGKSLAAFHEAGLVDRWELGIMPALLGDGIPLFPPGAGAVEPLRLVHQRVLKSGMIEAWYEPQRGTARL